MYWQEEDQPTEYQVPDDIIDLVFHIECRELAVDHAHALGQALLQALPILGEDNRVAIHTIHLAGSQNGWERPDPSLGQKLIPSKRTRLSIRLPKMLQQAVADGLYGVTLNVAGDAIKIGRSTTKLLSKQGTLFCRQVILQDGEQTDEEAFLLRMANELGKRGIRLKKALCGITQSIHTATGTGATRSLMLADLGTEDAISLQQRGIGEHGYMGCGIFIPHKGIDAVKKAGDE